MVRFEENAQQLGEVALTQPSKPAATLVRSGESTTGAPLRFIGNIVWVKQPGGPEPGSFTLIQNTIRAHGGPPLHVHEFEEFFYILEGSFLFEVDGVQLHAEPGDFVHVPGDLPHIFQNTSDQDGKVILVARPGGVEKYFAELAEHNVNNPGDLAAMNAIGLRYGIKILGPPIASRKK